MPVRILFLKADQLGLFDMPVQVSGSVDRHGHIRKPHVRVQKVRGKPPKPPVESGIKVDRKAAEKRPVTLDLFDSPHNRVPEPEPVSEPEPEPPAPAAEPGPGIDYSAAFDDIPIPAFGVAAGTSKAERRRLNAAARELLDKTEHSDADKRILAQYSGKGGVGDSLNEYYTSPDVAAAMWKTLRNLGVEGGEVLEPSCATGVFLATAPAGIRVTGVELDPTSAKIAHVLHGGSHEVRGVSLERFATSDERQFDAVVGNAPFGLRGAVIKDDKPDLKTAETYFLDTAVDKTRPGGVVAMIVPTGIMDGKNNRGFRERLIRKAEFLGAQRMPNTAFEHAHTGVTTDIVYLRRRPDDVAGALGTVDQGTLMALGVWDDEFLSGGYFAGRGADNVFGTSQAGWRAQAGIGDDITVTGSMHGVPAAIAEFQAPASDPLTVEAVLAAIEDEDARARAVGAAATPAYSAAKVGDTKVVDGITYVLQGDPPRWHRVDEVVDAAMVARATELAEEIERLMAGETADRPQLEKDIQAFIEEHGVPAKNKDLLLAAKADRRLHRLIGAVGLNGRLSDVVTGKTARRESSFDLAAQALALEHETRDFSAAELAERLGRETDEVEDHLVADASYAAAGSDRWAPMDAYLTGELWPKLDAVKAAQQAEGVDLALAEKYATQERLLLDAIDPKSLEDVEIQMNSAFIPTGILAAYWNWKYRESPDAHEWTKKLDPVEITFADGVYTITGGNEYGDQNILAKYLNRTGVRKDDLPAVERMNEEFKDWLTGSRYRDEIEDLYNRNFRGFKPVAFSDAVIDIPGLANQDAIKDYQWPGLRWALSSGKGIVAADVGLGKTLRALLLARMAQLQGSAKKPMIVVPKSVLANWAAEAEKWFPGSNVMVLGASFTRDDNGELKGRDDGPAERARKLHDLTQNDYDFIICAESVYQEVDLSPELKERYAGEDFWAQRGESLGNAGDKRRRKVREAYEQSIAGREFEKRTDAIYFDDLGVDMIIRDEGHREKNLWAARNRFGETPKFLGGQGESMRAYDFYLKSKYIREQNDGRNVYMLTATPTKNSPLEVYSMLSHIAPEAFERIGIRNSEEFLDRFCVFEQDRIYTLDGQFEEALVTSGFKNLGELREIMARYIDRKTAEDVGLDLPDRRDRMHYLDMNDDQRTVYADLRDRLAASKNSDDATGDAHIFAIMSDMAKAAMDLELYDPGSYAGHKSPKYEAVAKNAVELAADGGQVIFAEYVGAHQKIVDALVARGVPKSEIAVVNARVAASAAKRQNISDKFNAGRLKYVVGNSTMAEGMNLQRLTADIHHLDVPWEPATLQQRNGRGLRQGNLNEAVGIHTYISKGTFDGYRYQSMARKRDWQDLLWNGGDRVENLLKGDRVSHDDLAVMCADDPESAAKALAQNKELAAQRYEAEQRATAAREFERYQQLRSSHAKLTNKDSVSARRLKARITKARDNLKANKHFKAKSALDSGGPVLIHPATGDAIAANQGYDVPDRGGKTERVVVTAVHPGDKTVSIRRYGVPDGRTATVKMDRFGAAKPFDYDAAAETTEIESKLADQAEANVQSVDHPSKLRGLPPAVMDKHYGTVQDRLKTALKEYKWSSPSYSSAVGFVHPEGHAEFRPSYSAREAADAMDVMLPTAEHREKALAAWIAAERGKQFKHDYVTRRRGSSPAPILKQKYADEKSSYYGSHESNPWSAVGNDLFGPEFEREAREAFRRQQFEAARRADSFAGAVKAVIPTIEHSYAGTAWPRRSLAILWAKAKREGILDRPLKEVAVEHNEKYRREMPLLPREMTPAGSVHEAIASLAETNSHHDLAAVTHAARATDATSAVQAIDKIVGMRWSDKWQAVRHLVDKYGLGDRTPDELDLSRFDFAGKTNTPLRDILAQEERSAA